MASEPVAAVVVGAAIVDFTGGTPRVLAAQRADPPTLAGWWEFPGGKVEPGEDERVALVRECGEELGVEVVLGGRLGPDLPIADGRAVLRVWTATLCRGQPRAIEHAAIRWLTVERIHDVEWLPADIPLVELLRPLLAPDPPTVEHSPMSLDSETSGRNRPASALE